MAITIYQKKNFNGRSMDVTNSVRDLWEAGFNNSMSSIRMTDASDKVLLFKKKGYEGGVLFFNGVREVSSISSLRQNGKKFFNNAISSIRLSPFQVPLRIKIICTDDGQLPGNFDTRQQLEMFLFNALKDTNIIWNNALVEFEIGFDLEYVNNSRMYDVKNEFIKFAMKSYVRSGAIQVYIVNDLNNALGISSPVWPLCGKVAIIRFAGLTSSSSYEAVGRTIAHEFGHVCGIQHYSGHRDPYNLMNADVTDGIVGEVFSQKQVEQVHKTLATNLLRKGMRRGAL